MPHDKHYHAVQFYKDENSLATTVAKFLVEGINKGEPGVVVAAESRLLAIAAESRRTVFAAAPSALVVAAEPRVLTPVI